MTVLKGCKTFSEESILVCLSELKHELTDLTTSHELARMAKTASRIPLARSEQDHLVDIGGTIMWLQIYSRLLNYRRISLVAGSGHLRLIPLSQAVPHLAFEERRTRSGAGAGILREA